MVQHNLLHVPDKTNFDRYLSLVLIIRYCNIHFGYFLRLILQKFYKTDTIYWFIAQHYDYSDKQVLQD